MVQDGLPGEKKQRNGSFPVHRVAGQKVLLYAQPRKSGTTKEDLAGKLPGAQGGHPTRPFGGIDDELGDLLFRCQGFTYGIGPLGAAPQIGDTAGI